MYFTKGQSGIYHILHYLSSGTAPPPCGVKADQYDLRMYQSGRPTPNIVEEKPADARLCKNCEAATRKAGGGAYNPAISRG
jgi:hypothetical protein